MLSARLEKINPKYRPLAKAILFMVVIKLVSTLFYGCYYFFFTNTAPKLDAYVSNQLGWSLYFLKLTPYLDSSFLISSFKSPTTWLGVIVLVYLIRQRKKISWNGLGVGKNIRLLFILPGLLLCWELLTYDYNYYLDHSFLLERALMVLLLALIWFHPIYATGFLIVTLLFRAQFDFPIGGFPLFDKKILFDFYVLLTSFLLVRTRLKISGNWLVYFFIMIIAGSYFATGLGKIRISPHGYEWVTENPLHYLVMHGNERGWEFSSHLIPWLKGNAVILQIGVLLLELSALVILFKRKLSMVLIILFISMHFAIFYLGGILFWKWIIIDLCALFVIFGKSQFKVLYSRPFFKLSLIVVPLATFWLSTFTIGWLDTKFNQTFKYQAVLENGEVYELSKSTFNPYHQLFNHDKFLYLVDDRRIKITGFGYTFKHPVASALNNADSIDIPSLEQTFGDNYFDPVKNEKHTAFIRTFFQNYNDHLGEFGLRHYLKAPKHLYNYINGRQFDDQGKVVRVNVYLHKTIIDDKRTVTLEKILVKSVSISNNNPYI